jgi:hypothetical protein
VQPAAVLAVLRAARSQGLIDDLDDVVAGTGGGDYAATNSRTAAAAVGHDIGLMPEVSNGSASAGGSTAAGSPGLADAAAEVSSGGSGSDDDSGGSGSNGSSGGSGGAGVHVPFALLRAAVGSRQEALRVDVLQLISSNVRTSSLPGAMLSIERGL